MVTPEQAARLADGYLELIQFDRRSEAGTMVFGAGRDLGSLSKAIEARYGVGRRTAQDICRFFANVATVRANQLRQQQLGIVSAKWTATTCGLKKGSPHAGHRALSGRKFDLSTGLLVDGRYLLPGSAIGCTCIARAIIPGLEDEG